MGKAQPMGRAFCFGHIVEFRFLISKLVRGKSRQIAFNAGILSRGRNHKVERKLMKAFRK